MKDTMVVVGGGAAGMMTAIHASEDYDVSIIEKNEKPGKKLFITGKGRCNVTNHSDEEVFLKNVVTNPKFLYSAIYSYNSERVMSDFERWGVRLKTERGERVFPVSDKSSDIIRALTDELKRKNVRVLYNTKVSDIIIENEEAKGVTLAFSGEKIFADKVVLATGGLSYPRTGSTGEGFKILAKHGIDIVPARPSLVPLETKEKDASDMMGLSLKNVSVRVLALKKDYPTLKKDKVIFSDFGEMLFTHFGVSGPLILSASSYISSFWQKNVSEREGVPGLILQIDLKPALTDEELDRRVLRDFEEFRNREFQNSLGKLLPRLMIPVIIKRCGIRPDKKVNEITAEERNRLVKNLKNLEFTVTNLRGFDEAIITGGGVSVKEINPQNMELKKIKNLRVTGELIDCDALTGGFNLQIAWCTAYMAAGKNY